MRPGGRRLGRKRNRAGRENMTKNRKQTDRDRRHAAPASGNRGV